MRARRWWGVDVGDREVYLWGAPVELGKTDRVKTVRDRLLNQMLLNAFEMSAANMDAYLEAIQAFRPDASTATPAASRCSPRARASAGCACDCRSCAWSARRASRSTRISGTLIEQVFGVPAANEFGSRDIGFTAHESPHRQILLMSESIILEVLDRRRAPGAGG